MNPKIHPSADAQAPHIGEGTKIWQYVVVLPKARIVRDCKIGRELDNFSSGSVFTVLASNKYDEDDYYHDYAEFMRARWQA